MEQETIKRICLLVNDQGQEILDDPNKFKGLMLDYCYDIDKRDLNVLTIALQQKIPRLLLSLNVTKPTEDDLKPIAHRLVEDTAMTDSVALWAVDTLAFILGIIDHAPQVAAEKNTSSLNIAKETMTEGNYVGSGVIVVDFNWHLIKVGESPNWLDDSKFLPILMKGYSIDDGIFDFRLNPKTNSYELSLKKCFNQYYYDKLRSKPTDESVKIRYGSIIRDYYWHPIDFAMLYDGLKRPAVQLDLNKGQEWAGKIFIYRRNFSHERYEVRIRDDVPIPQEYHRPSSSRR